MDQAQITQLANILNIDDATAKDFASSVSTSNLTSLIGNIETGNKEEIETEFNIYLSNVNDYVEEDEEYTVLDKEFEIRKAYDDLKREGMDHDRATYEIMLDFGIDSSHELEQIIKGPMTEFTNLFDEEINEVFKKIESLKKNPVVVNDSFIKGLSELQIEQIINKTNEEVGTIINLVKNMKAKEIAESYIKILGLKTISILEYQTDIDDMRDVIIYNKLSSLFEAMKNKWHKRSYWRKRPKNVGLGTVGHPDFDFYSKLDPYEKIKVDDYGTIDIYDGPSAASLKNYIVTQSKK